MLHGLCLQRICDDVPAFTDASTKLIMSAVRQLLNCVVFAGMQPLVDNDTVFCCCQATSTFYLVLCCCKSYLLPASFNEQLPLMPQREDTLSCATQVYFGL
jgi:hypothetical protein